MKFLAFTVALLVAGLPAVPTLAKHDDPVQFGKDVKDDKDRLPTYSINDTAVALGIEADHKTPASLASIRVVPGGKVEAQKVFMHVAGIDGGNDGAVQTFPNITNNWVDSDGINSIICTIEFKKSGNSREPLLSKLHYQEHKSTGLAWLQYEFKNDKRAHRIIFLDRICHVGIANGVCGSYPNIADNTTRFVYTGDKDAAVTYCKEKLNINFLRGLREFGDGGGGGEM